MFKTNEIIESYIRIICVEGRGEELINISDTYHKAFDNKDIAMEWGIDFGEYLGKHHYGDPVWKFKLFDEDIYIYFIGSLEEVKRKVYKVL